MSTLPFVPATWMPDAPMKRIVTHWTAGSHTPSETDKEHYHFLIDGAGKLHLGEHPITANVPPLREGEYAAHTRATNSYAIGVSLCCMAGAVERPFDAGRYPMTETQWTALLELLAVLCKRYGIPVTPKTVLSHAEVQGNLGIWQRGKWDYTILPFKPSVKGVRAVGDLMRAGVEARL